MGCSGQDKRRIFVPSISYCISSELYSYRSAVKTLLFFYFSLLPGIDAPLCSEPSSDLRNIRMVRQSVQLCRDSLTA